MEKTNTQTTSTKCQYNPTGPSAGRRPLLNARPKATPRTINNAIKPTQTCRPWNPVSVKNVVAKRSSPTLTPLRYKSQYSIPCPTMKMPPSKMVNVSHIFILPGLFVRSATSDRQIVKLLAKRQTLKMLVLNTFNSCAPAPPFAVALYNRYARISTPHNPTSDKMK